MAGSDLLQDPGRALEYKEQGNRHFQAQDFIAAEACYTKAINFDSANHLLYTNRAMANLKLTRWDEVITDSLQAIELSPVNMKGYYYLAQAEIELERPREALESAKKAHEYCVQEIQKGGKGGGSIGPITQLVLRAKKEDWERREKERIRSRKGLLVELLENLERKRDQELEEAKEAGEVESREIKVEWETKIETLKRAFEDASRIGGVEGSESRRRKVPDWVVDDITFSVMVDPVVTKTGQSYDRSSIMEHLKRSPTDPLTREPLRAEDLRPNLALKEACEEFLVENGWAVDW